MQYCSPINSSESMTIEACLYGSRHTEGQAEVSSLIISDFPLEVLCAWACTARNRGHCWVCACRHIETKAELQRV